MIVCMKPLTINLPDDLEAGLEELSRREKASPEETVCRILRNRLWLDRFHQSCAESEKLAKAAGFESEDDILRIPS